MEGGGVGMEWNGEHVAYLQRKMATFFAAGIYVKEKKK
jgi:hypothetical protein